VRGRHRRGERGQILVFVVGITAALLLLAGLSVDGGRILSAREKALDEAQEAARTAAQQLNQGAIRTGAGAPIDTGTAELASQRYLAATGDTGDVTVSGSDVTVTVHRSVSMEVLGLVGIGTVTVSESGTAHASRGTVAGT
jgi:Flp pilus assembly protein TadG